ncbi:TPA: hypothetical protein I8Y81_003103 [Legionella pneumophila]|nr:hypothetical protein [Legionella pneumophila]
MILPENELEFWLLSADYQEASVARMEWNETRGVRYPISWITAAPASRLRWAI